MRIDIRQYGGQVDENDLRYALERAPRRIIAAVPAPISVYENGQHAGMQKINPHVTAFELEPTLLDRMQGKHRYFTVFHVKPNYYLHQNGEWRPLAEITTHLGNHRLDLIEDWDKHIDLRYLAWLLKRMDLIGGTINIPSPYKRKDFAEVVPLRHGVRIGERAATILFTTTTFYPDPNPETTTVDGQTKRQASVGGEVWANMRGNAGTTSSDSVATDDFFQLNAYGGSPTGWYESRRAVYLFDTSALTSGATISAAIMSKWVVAKNDTSSTYALTAEIVVTAPASNTGLASTDYNIAKWTMTRQATGIAQGSLSAGAYNDFTFNATGRGNVSKTGVSKFGIVHDKDLDNSEPTMDGAHQTDYTGAFADTSGTSNDPKLAVTYTSSTAYTKDLTESVTLVDTVKRGAGKSIKDVITLVDTVDIIQIFTKALTETVTLVDTIRRDTAKILTDTVTLVASVARAGARLLTETITLVAAETINRFYARAFSEAITVTDSIRKGAGKAIEETITLVDTVAKRFTAIRLTDVITLVASASSIHGYFKSFTETITLVATLTKVGAYSRRLTEHISLATRLFLNGVNAAWLLKYTRKATTWIGKYTDPK